MIYEINYKFDKSYLSNLFLENFDSVKPFQELDGNVIENFHILKISDDKYVSSLLRQIGFSARPRFLWMKKGCELPYHVDAYTKCAINIILNDNEPDPIHIQGKDYYYQQGLIDVTKLHTVKATKDRLIFKYSFFDNSYDELLNRLIELKWIISHGQ